MVCNLFWGNHLRYFGDKISLNRRPSLISLISRQNNAKHHRHYFDCRFVQSTNLAKKSNKKSLLKFLLLFAFAKSRISLFSRHCEANRRFAEAIQNFCDSKNDKFKSAQSANPIKSFCYFWLSPKVESPFFIDSAFDSQSIRATNRNGRDCGGDFVFVRIFGIETRLRVCEIPKILTSAKDALISELTCNDIYLQITHKSTAFKANLI